MRWPLLTAALLALALLVQGGSTRSSPAPDIVATGAAGTLSVTNSLDGAAIFDAGDVGPGDTAGGSVTIANNGTLWAELTLSEDNIVDAPGSGGGPLSSRLDLVVSDVTSGTPAVKYSGKLDAMPPTAVGTIAPGGSRTYQVSATLPHGSGDNAFEDSSVTSRFVWTAADTVAPPDPPPAPPVVAEPEPVQSAEGDEVPSESALGGDGAPRLRLRVPRIQRIVTNRRFTAFVSCNESCWMRASALLPAGTGQALTRRVRARMLVRGVRMTPRRRVSAGRRVRVTVPLSGRPLAVMGRALRLRRPTALTLLVVARDDAGNTTVLERRVRFRPFSRTRRP